MSRLKPIKSGIVLSIFNASGQLVFKIAVSSLIKSYSDPLYEYFCIFKGFLYLFSIICCFVDQIRIYVIQLPAEMYINDASISYRYKK